MQQYANVNVCMYDWPVPAAHLGCTGNSHPQKNKAPHSITIASILRGNFVILAWHSRVVNFSLRVMFIICPVQFSTFAELNDKTYL